MDEKKTVASIMWTVLKIIGVVFIVAYLCFVIFRDPDPDPELEAMRKKVEEFMSRDFINEEDALEQYNVFYAENKDNKYLTEADNHVFNYVDLKIKKRLKNFAHGEESFYRSLENLAEKVQISKSKKIRGSWIGEFAEAFVNMMNSPHKVTVTQLRGEAGAPVLINKVWWRKNYGELYLYGVPLVPIDTATFQNQRDMIPVVFSAKTIECHPWEVLSIECDLWQQTSPHTDLPNVSIDIFPGKKGESGCRYSCLHVPYVKTTVFYEKNYKNVYEILCGLDKADLVK